MFHLNRKLPIFKMIKSNEFIISLKCSWCVIASYGIIHSTREQRDTPKELLLTYQLKARNWTWEKELTTQEEKEWKKKKKEIEGEQVRKKKYIENVILWTKYLSQGLNNQLKGGFI